MTAAKPSPQDAVLDALQAEANRTVAEIALATGIGRSTAGKALAALEQAGKVQRDAGGRDGARRLPDRWSLAATEEPSKPSTSSTDAPARDPVRVVTADVPNDERAEQDAVTAGAHTAAKGSGRLRPGQLDGLVLEYLTTHADDGPLGPGPVAKALGRSSGAVGNCLARLASTGRARLVSDRPRHYSLP